MIVITAQVTDWEGATEIGDLTDTGRRRLAEVVRGALEHERCDVYQISVESRSF